MVFGFTKKRKKQSATKLKKPKKKFQIHKQKTYKTIASAIMLMTREISMGGVHVTKNICHAVFLTTRINFSAMNEWQGLKRVGIRVSVLCLA